MAKKLSVSSDKGTPSSSSLRQDDDIALNAGSNINESTSQCNTKADSLIPEVSCFGMHTMPLRAVPYCDGLVVKELASKLAEMLINNDGQPVRYCDMQRPLPADSSNSLHPDTAVESTDAMDRIREPLDSTRSLSLRTGENLLTLYEMTHKVYATVCQLSSMLQSCPLVITSRQEAATSEAAQGNTQMHMPREISGGTLLHSDPYSSIESGAVPRDRSQIRCHRSPPGGLATVSEAVGQHEVFQLDLGDSSCSLMDTVLCELMALKRNVESTLTTVSLNGSSSQTWIPHELAQRVSRVCCYSHGYAEEVSCPPLEMSGYTLRLILICEKRRGDVMLCFRGQFCACTANEKMTWPFLGELELTIHHPTDSVNNRVHRARPSERQETNMPREVNGPPMHLAGPIPVATLHEEGLWAMGTLHLSARIL